MSEPSFDHKNYKFSAIYIPDEHSPSLASQDSWNNLNVCTFGKSFGLIARSQDTDVPILSIYGIEALDFNQTLSLVITNIVFGHNTCPEYELEDTDFVLTNLFKYMIGCLGMSTDAPIVFVDERDIKAVSYLQSYNAHHIYPTDIIREWFRETTTKSLFAELDADMNAKVKATHPNYLYRLVSQSFNYSFLTKWMNIGWKGPFYLDFDDEPVDRTVSIDLQKHPGLVGEDETLFNVWKYSQVNYMGLEKWFKSESYSVKFCAAEDEDKCKGSIPVSISLTEEQIEYITKVSPKGNRSKFIQKLITDEMGRTANVEYYKPILNNIQERIKCLPENQHREDDKTLPAATQVINKSSNGAFHLFLSKCLFLSKWHTATEYTFRDWMAVFEHVTKIEEADRHFLNSDHKYKCLELTVRESSDWSPLLCDLAGGINILVSPTHDINDKNGVVYKCVALNSEVRRNAVIYSNDDPLTSTIRLLIIDRLSRDAGFEADSYPLDDAMKQAIGNMKQASRKLLLEQLEKDIVIR